MKTKLTPQVRRTAAITGIYLLVTAALFYVSVLLVRNSGPLGLREVLATILDVAWCLPITVGRMVPNLPTWGFVLLILVNAAIAAFVISIFADVIRDRRKPKPVDPDDAPA